MLCSALRALLVELFRIQVHTERGTIIFLQ